MVDSKAEPGMTAIPQTVTDEEWTWSESAKHINDRTGKEEHNIAL